MLFCFFEDLVSSNAESALPCTVTHLFGLNYRDLYSYPGQRLHDFELFTKDVAEEGYRIDSSGVVYNVSVNYVKLFYIFFYVLFYHKRMKT